MIERFSAYAPIVQRLFALAPSDELVEWVLRIHLPLTGWIDNHTVLLGDSAHATLPVRPSALRFERRKADVGDANLSTSHKARPWLVRTEVSHSNCHAFLLPGSDDSNSAVLAAVLSQIDCKEDVPRALALYQVRRLPHSRRHQKILTNMISSFPSLQQSLRKPRADWAVESARLTGTTLHLPDGPAQEARDKAIGIANRPTAGQNPDRWGDRETQNRLYGLDVVAEALRESKTVLVEA